MAKKTHFRLPDPKRKRALALYSEGMTAAQVAEVVGLGVSTVARLVRLAGIARPATGHRARKFERGEREAQAKPRVVVHPVIEAAERGWRGLAEYAEAEGLTSIQVQQRLHKARAGVL